MREGAHTTGITEYPPPPHLDRLCHREIRCVTVTDSDCTEAGKHWSRKWTH